MALQLKLCHPSLDSRFSSIARITTRECRLKKVPILLRAVKQQGQVSTSRQIMEPITTLTKVCLPSSCIRNSAGVRNRAIGPGRVSQVSTGQALQQLLPTTIQWVLVRQDNTLWGSNSRLEESAKLKEPTLKFAGERSFHILMSRLLHRTNSINSSSSMESLEDSSSNYRPSRISDVPPLRRCMAIIQTLLMSKDSSRPKLACRTLNRLSNPTNIQQRRECTRLSNLVRSRDFKPLARQTGQVVVTHQSNLTNSASMLPFKSSSRTLTINSRLQVVPLASASTLSMQSRATGSSPCLIRESAKSTMPRCNSYKSRCR